MFDIGTIFPYSDLHQLNLDWVLKLCKDLSDQWDETKTDWENMRDFINNYFNNLDVQKEIDNKLNSMISDGSFSDIILPIVASFGNPVVVGTISEMIDHNKLYILSSDGYLYYYNDDNFVRSNIVYGDLDNAFLYNNAVTVENLTEITKYGSYSVNAGASDIPKDLQGRVLTLLNIPGFNIYFITQIIWATDSYSYPYVRIVSYSSGSYQTYSDWRVLGSGSSFIDNGNIFDKTDLINLVNIGSYGISRNANPSDIPDNLKDSTLTLVNIRSFLGNYLTQIVWATKQYNKPYIRVITLSDGKWSVYKDWISIGENEVDPNYPYNNMKWCVIGDSFTHGDFSGGDTPYITEGKYSGYVATYPHLIGNRNHMNIINLSVNGMAMAGDSGFAATMLNDIPNDSDYITIMLGINDSGDHQNIPIGTINDENVNTFYGAWNVTFNYLVTNNISAHIGIIVPNGISFENRKYADAIIDIAKKWCVPFINLNYGDECPTLIRSGKNPEEYSSAFLHARDEVFKVSDSNRHPNALCHEYESRFLEQWLYTL